MAPTDDPKAIATRYATVARKVINGAAQIAIDAFDKINGDPGSFTGKDAIESATQLAGIAITGAAELARIPLQIQPDNGPLLVADEVASVVQTAVSDAAAVAGDAAEKVNAGTFKDNWVDSAITLTGMAVLRTAEIAEAIGAGPGVLANPLMKFGPYTVNAAVADDLVLQMGPLSRPTVDEDISGIVRFIPAGGALKPGRAKKFWLVINTAGIPSGVFRGTVKVLKNGAAQQNLAVKVIVNL